MNCFSCQNETVQELGVAGIRPGSVTSDSWTCPLAAVIQLCPRCGHLQKHHDAATLEIGNRPGTRCRRHPPRVGYVRLVDVSTGSSDSVMSSLRSSSEAP